MAPSTRLRIAEVAPLFGRVPPVTHGGTERIVHYLTEALVERGHDVTLFASADSCTSARLRAAREETLFDTWTRGDSWRSEFAHISEVMEVLRDSRQFDLIHFHLGPFSAPLSAVARVPTLHTMPSPLFPDEAWTLLRFPEAQMIARSRRQVEDLPGWRRRNIHVIYNGCDFRLFQPPQGEGRYLAYLGRMSPEKNPLDAIRIAHMVEMPIVLAGEPIEDGDRDYFDSEIRPLLDSREVTWIGPVNDTGKSEFLSGAAALLFPIQLEEAFGNVMIEAMASGVPVLAFDCGSVAEVVDLDLTGYYADTAEELANLVPRAIMLDRSRIREHAARRFSREVMADAYLRLYESTIAGFVKPVL